VKVVPHLRARHLTIEGDAAARNGQTGRAIVRWTKAAELLDAVRAKLPPLDMRSAFFQGHTDPYQKLIASEIDKNPESAMVWADRYKTAGMWAAPDDLLQSHAQRRRAEQSLSELASAVTAIAEQISANGKHRGTASAAADPQLSRLHRQIRENLAVIERDAESTQNRQHDIAKMMRQAGRDTPIVQFHFDRGALYGFVHYRGDSLAHKYVDGPVVAESLINRWRFLIEMSSFADRNPDSTDLRDQADILDRLSRWLLAPLDLPSDTKRLLIVPDGLLWNVPWQALRINGDALLDRFHVVLSPSIRHYQHAQTHRAVSDTANVFIGAADDLHDAARDYRALLESGNGSVTVYDPCRRDDWPSDSEAMIWHYTGHAVWNSENPFYSALLLEDGPLFAADFRLKRNRVNLATLAACRTGQQNNAPGQEFSGLVRSLIEMGARNVLASHWAVANEPTAAWMDAFYKAFFRKRSLGEALREASVTVRNKYPSAYYWAAFSLFGAGE
jgi:CHAT domain-containing protein